MMKTLPVILKWQKKPRSRDFKKTRT
jgi:hypothetical protein